MYLKAHAILSIMRSLLLLGLASNAAGREYFCDGLNTILVEPEGGMYAGYAYWFKKDQYVKYNANKDTPDSQAPRPLSAWGGLPQDLDAAFADAATNQAYFFKGNQVYKWDTPSDKLATGYPHGMSDEFPGLPADWLNSGIEAVFTETSKGKRFGAVYFMKASSYMAYNLTARKPISAVGKISDLLPGMPTGDIDAILVEPIHAGLGNYIYFFKGDSYWKWDMTKETRVAGPTQIHAGWTWDCAPPPPPAPILKWECHADQKSGLPRDLIISDTLAFESLEMCQGNCTLLSNLGSSKCVSLSWHETNHECHAKIGEHTHDEFMQTLESDQGWQACYGTPINSTLLV